MVIAEPIPFTIISTDLSDTTNLTDDIIGTQVEQAESLTVRFSADMCDLLFFAGVEGTTVTIAQYDGEGIATQSIDVNHRYETYTDLWGYYTDPIEFQSSFPVEIMDFSGGDVEITIENPGATAKLGIAVAAITADFGNTKASRRLGIKSFSKKEFDEDFGTLTLTPRGRSKRWDGMVYIPKTQYGIYFSRLERLDAKKVVFMPSGVPEETIYGIWSDFEMLYEAGDDQIAYTLTIEGLV